MIILQYHEIFFMLTAPKCPGKAAGAVSLRKSHDIVILSLCNIVKGQAKYEKIPQNNISCQKCSVKNNYLFPFQKLMKYVDVHILLHSLKSGSLVAF